MAIMHFGYRSRQFSRFTKSIFLKILQLSMLLNHALNRIQHIDLTIFQQKVKSTVRKVVSPPPRPLENPVTRVCKLRPILNSDMVLPGLDAIQFDPTADLQRFLAHFASNYTVKSRLLALWARFKVFPWDWILLLSPAV